MQIQVVQLASLSSPRRKVYRQQRRQKTPIEKLWNKNTTVTTVFVDWDEEDPKQHCVLCYETLANENMKPAKQHLESKHKEYKGNPSQFYAPGENMKTIPFNC